MLFKRNDSNAHLNKAVICLAALLLAVGLVPLSAIGENLVNTAGMQVTAAGVASLEDEGLSPLADDGSSSDSVDDSAASDAPEDGTENAADSNVNSSAGDSGDNGSSDN